MRFKTLISRIDRLGAHHDVTRPTVAFYSFTRDFDITEIGSRGSDLVVYLKVLKACERSKPYDLGSFINCYRQNPYITDDDGHQLSDPIVRFDTGTWNGEMKVLAVCQMRDGNVGIELGAIRMRRR